MEVEIKQLLPNPYRNLPEYPIDREKVKGLVKSIKDTSFWDNLLARPSRNGSSGNFEIAYGHHRLVALHELYGKTSSHKVDIPVRELDDAFMLKIMANENAKDWSLNTSVVVETVKAARKFLIEHPEHRFVSKETEYHRESSELASFLGGVISEVTVRDALLVLDAIEDKKVSKAAIKAIPSPRKASTFVAAIRESAKPVPVQKQLEIAREIREEKLSRDEIKPKFRNSGYRPEYKPQHEKSLTDEDRELLRKIAESMKRPLPSLKAVKNVPPYVIRTAKEIIETGYKLLAKDRHPDRGGSQREMQNLNAAIGWLRLLVSKEVR
jgi:ParB-like nuclease domain